MSRWTGGLSCRDARAGPGRGGQSRRPRRGSHSGDCRQRAGPPYASPPWAASPVSPGPTSASRSLALVALVVIVVTGAAVRLTGSGLGCSDWPTCDDDPARGRHRATPTPGVEFVNRLFTGLVSVAVILAVLGSLLRVPRRRDLIWLSSAWSPASSARSCSAASRCCRTSRPRRGRRHFLLSMLSSGTPSCSTTGPATTGRRAGRSSGPVRADGRALVGLGARRARHRHGGHGHRAPRWRRERRPRLRSTSPTWPGCTASAIVAVPGGDRVDAVAAAPERHRRAGRPARRRSSSAHRRAGRHRLHAVLHRCAACSWCSTSLGATARVDRGRCVLPRPLAARAVEARPRQL